MERFYEWANWGYANWQALLAIPVAAIFATVGLLFAFTESDPDLSDKFRRMEIASELASELKGLELPPNTSVTEFEQHAEFKPHIFIDTGYRTQNSNDEFLKWMNNELKDKGWVLYAKETIRSFTSFKFCRGKYDAILTLHEGGWIWEKEYSDWSLSFSLGLATRPFFGADTLPESCKSGID